MFVVFFLPVTPTTILITTKFLTPHRTNRDYNPCERHGPVHDGVERRSAHDMSGWEERALDPAGGVEQTWGEDPEGKVPIYMVAGRGLDGRMCICGCARLCMLVSQVYVK